MSLTLESNIVAVPVLSGAAMLRTLCFGIAPDEGPQVHDLRYPIDSGVNLKFFAGSTP